MLATAVSNAMLDTLFARGDVSSTITTSTACYLGMSTTTPVISSDGTIGNFVEPNESTGYKRSRLGIRGNSATYIMDSAANGEIKNGENFIFFDEAVIGGGGFGTLSHFGLFPSKTGGKPILTGALTNSVTVAEGNVLIFRPDNLKVSME